MKVVITQNMLMQIRNPIHSGLKLTVFLLLLTSATICRAQAEAKLVKKMTANMCTCVGVVEKYDHLKSKIEECFDKAIADAVKQATPDDELIIANPELFKRVKDQVTLKVLTDCEHVKKLVEAEAAAAPPENPYPVNFGPEELKKATENPSRWAGEVVAFDAKIVEVHMPSANKPYMKVKLKDGQILWVGSMVNSKYDKVGHTIRFLGYFTLTNKDDFSHKYHSGSFHVLVFAEIDQKSKQLAFMPGAEAQIKEWSQGRIPEVKK